jgi:hypothetical protein
MSLISSMFTTVQIAHERYDMCKQCPSLTAIKLCQHCGCVMPAKVRLRYAECPVGNWKAVEDDGQMHFVDDEAWAELDKDAELARSV